jgi:DNA primase
MRTVLENQRRIVRRCAVIDAIELKKHAGLAPFKTRLPGLKGSGKKYSTHCPFHEAANPSFDVFKDGDVWLFGCEPCKAKGESKAKGDVFTFVQKKDNISFADALKKVAAETGFAVTETPSALA